MYPNCKIRLNLLLPTKIDSLNYRVKELCLRDISHSYRNISIIYHPVNQLCNKKLCLKDEYGRFDKEAGTPFSRDTLDSSSRE